MTLSSLAGLPTLSPLGPGTLGRRLTVRVVLLVVAVAVLLASLFTLSTRQLLIGQIDGQLNSAVARQQRGPDNSPGPKGPRGLSQLGQTEGTLVVVEGATWVTGAVLDDGRPADLNTGQLTQLVNLDADSRKRTITVEGLGRYRVICFTDANGRETVVGLPLSGTDNLLYNLAGLALLVTVLAIGGAVLAVRALITDSLRPLNRLAGTAHAVSQRKLDSGEVDLEVRVPEGDADPRSEVGQVGYAFNHMLSNIAGALAARQASETKVRQFVADASHELRNPLAAIRGYAELTRRSRDQLPPDTAFALGRVESEAERMSRLVEDLLLLARLDAASEGRVGQVSGGPNPGDHNPGGLEVSELDLTDLVVNAVSDARAAGPEHHWGLELPDVPVTVPADRYRIHQVLVNLLANARTHTPPGTRVVTGLVEQPGSVGLWVEDDGPGINPELQPHVFERFTRADSSRARAKGAATGTSTGLGLAIVAAVVEAHHGRTEVDSRPGRTRFTVWLPRP